MSQEEHTTNRPTTSPSWCQHFLGSQISQKYQEFNDLKHNNKSKTRIQISDTQSANVQPNEGCTNEMQPVQIQCEITKLKDGNINFNSQMIEKFFSVNDKKTDEGSKYIKEITDKLKPINLSQANFNLNFFKKWYKIFLSFNIACGFLACVCAFLTILLREFGYGSLGFLGLSILFNIIFFFKVWKAKRAYKQLLKTIDKQMNYKSKNDSQLEVPQSNDSILIITLPKNDSIFNFKFEPFILQYTPMKDVDQEGIKVAFKNKQETLKKENCQQLKLKKNNREKNSSYFSALIGSFNTVKIFQTLLFKLNFKLNNSMVLLGILQIKISILP